MVPAMMCGQMKSIQRCNADDARAGCHASHADLKQDTVRQLGMVARASERRSHARNARYSEAGQGRAGQGRAGQGRAGQGSIRLDNMPRQSKELSIHRTENLPFLKAKSIYIESKCNNGRCMLLVIACLMHSIEQRR